MSSKKKPLNPKAQAKPQKTKPLINIVDELLDKNPLGFDSFYIAEPKLTFGSGFTSVDPKSGIASYGPFDMTRSAGSSIILGVVGTGDGIQSFVEFLQTSRRKVSPGFNSKKKAFDPRCFPYFPGATASESFRCEFKTDSSFHRTLTERDIATALKADTIENRLSKIVAMVVAECEALEALEHGPDVIVVMLPDSVRKEFGPQGNIAMKKKPPTPVQKLQKHLDKMAAKKGTQIIPNLLVGLDGGELTEDESVAWNVHHAIKAHCMKLNTPTQIIWQATLQGIGVTQDPASIAWNIFTGLYYKSNHIPWQLQSLPDNTCFVGISFYKDSPGAEGDMQTSLAQVFGAGEGLVLKGERAVVDKKRDRKAHLTQEGAKSILSRAIEIFTAVNQQPPKRVVVHKTSRYWPEELRGFEEALGDIRFHDFLAIESFNVSVRLMRVGHNPPLRGTAMKLGPRHYLLYTVGYVPYYRLYPGMRTPRPVEILEHYGDSSAFDVCKEILALTKLNWNSCAFANSEPITISFARSVGKILAQLPDGITPQSKYRFYM